MSEEAVWRWLRILPVSAAVVLFAGILYIGREHPERTVLKACEELRGYLAVKSRNTGWYQRTQEWLDKKGAVFHFGGWLQPGAWLTLCIVTGFAGFVIGLQFSFWCGIAAAVLLCGLPGILVQYLDYRDNERMLPEIKLIYHGLEIQIRAGVYVTDALAECYAGVQEMRLKQALLDLAGAVTMQSDVYDALEHFQSRFDNRYIDALCITLLQAMESGQAVELLSDIAEQVKDMEVAVMGRRKGALDRSVTFYQLGILAAVLGVVLYACITQMFAAALQF
jgi:Flp pilus assembly protein TadB